MHDLDNLPNMVCIADYLHGGCPAGLRQIKTYSSSIDQDDAIDQCSNFPMVKNVISFCLLFILFYF